MINWKKEVEKRQEQIIAKTQEFLRINSVLDESTASEKQPFGAGINEALTHMLKIGEDYHFFVKNLDGYAGIIEHGNGEESVGILCHLDVVPVGEGWTTLPFSATIRDGRIYARGAIDNKGPTMAAFFALAIVSELDLPLSKRVRMILGTDEESQWRCVDYYFKHEEMPTIGFAPDADFPIIHAEKGIADASLKWSYQVGQDSQNVTLSRFHAGERFNMVPDQATATLSGDRVYLDKIEEAFRKHLLQNRHIGTATFEEQTLTLTYEGISAHGSTPEKGINAGIELVTFLSEVDLQSEANDYLAFVVKNLLGDSSGEALGIATRDDVSGQLTVNAGLFRFDGKEASIGLNIRYPVTASGEQCLGALQLTANKHSATCTVLDHMEPNYVEADHSLIQTLQAVYERQTGEEATLLAIGGGTYARSLDTGVAFGPMFPGREDVAHQKDEYIDIDDLLKATAIYAEAIYELAK